MPSIKNRQRIIAQNFISSSGLYSDISLPHERFFLAASPVSGMSASVAAYQVSGSIAGLRYTGTKNTCPLTVQVFAPTNVAIAAPAAGSGIVYIDWTDVTLAGASAVVAASLWAIPNGSGIGAASTLGSACAQFSCSSVCDLNAASLFAFTALSTRNAHLALRTIVSSLDANNTSGSNFVLFGFRLRYLADRIGS